MPYSFKVVTPDTTTNALALGATVTGTLNEAGEEDRYTFTGTAGQRLYYDALDADNLSAVNTTNLTDTKSFTVIVNEVNSAPVLTVPANTNINELATLTVTNTATDSDIPANALTFSLVSVNPAPSGAVNLNPTTGVLTFTPSETDGRVTNVFTIRVTDYNPSAVNTTNLTDTKSFTVIVNEVNFPPVVGPLTNRTVNPAQTISFSATATDPDIPANTLSFSLVNPPAGATIISGSGAFNWRPTVAQAGTTNTVTVRATDNGSPNLSDTNSFTVIVNASLPVVLTPISYSNGQFRFQASGTTGPDYVIMASSNLTQWSDIFTNLSPATPFLFTNSSAAINRFYRARLSP